MSETRIGNITKSTFMNASDDSSKGHMFDIAAVFDKKITDVESKLAELPCKINNHKIGLLEKVVFGFIGLVLVGFVAAIISVFIPKQRMPQKSIYQPMSIISVENIEKPHNNGI